MKIECKALVLGCLLVTVLVGMPIVAAAQCKSWYVGGAWEVEQRGLTYKIVLTLDQNGKQLTGKAGISTNKGYPAVNVYGTVEGDLVNFRILWIDGSVGIYDGQFLPGGRLDGYGYEKKTPNIRHMWQSSKKFKCPPPPSFNVPLNGYKGKPKPTPDNSTTKPKTEEPPPPPMKVPGIIASQVIYSLPGAYTGTVVLTWDAGPDHPYAEVWYKVNNGDDIFLVEQGKGSRQMPVDRGKYYTYILTDSGQTLATVNVVGN
ncbi:MAG: hypothetical protein QM785_08520 [Pyrinomonadaceae bacterium]